MADAAATKQQQHLSINGGSLMSELKSQFSFLKNRRTVAVAYGFMFAFVAFTVFLAFNPSPNSYAPWFSNIFTITYSDSYRSQDSSFFSHFLPNNTDKITNSSSSAQNSTSRSNEVKNPSANVQNQTQIPAVDSVNPAVLHANQSSTSIANNSSIKIPPTSKNSSEDQALKLNQTTITAPTSPVIANQAANSSVNSPVQAANSSVNSPVQTANSSVNSPAQTANSSVNSPAQMNKSANADEGVTVKQKKETGKLNYTGASPVKQPSNGIDDLVKKMVNCDLFDGEWVKDDSYPLYKPGSCSFIDEQFNCIRNGRPDKNYQKYKWKPKGCSVPRLNPAHMLKMLKGKRLVFVGDSLNRNMWESLVCMLKGAAKDPSKVFEANGRVHFRGEFSYSFIFKDYDCTVEFFVSPFLVQEWEMPDKDGTKKETLRLDLVGRSSDQYKNADIIVFNTGHWWTHEKTAKGKDYYQEGSHVYNDLNVLEAFRKALTTWARWVDANINPMKSQVFFRGYSASHFSGGQWNSGGACDNEVEPIKNATYLQEYPSKMLVLEKVLRGMKNHVTYLNVTQMTDYRKDGHPSIYRKPNVKSPLLYQDCSHWCLPGVPDAWNEILYAELLLNEYQKRQVQKRQR
ncbi:protein trichome birefringence [Mercurialis annua]|uniref:protein trichome birefringence n=1 Tax=Mercurialis annua TaxID=3986 RepID=UPI00215F857B|nr:protein trichome birefringence [Mercurialis annua]